MSDNDLKNFCRQVLLAIEGKAVPVWFHPSFALCTNAGRYDHANDTLVYKKLHEIFYAEPYPFNEGELYPFNEGDLSNYRNERWDGGFYKNEKRLAFLRKYAYGA